MRIKVIAKNGKSRVLVVNSLELMKRIVNKFDRWEYK